MNHHLPPFASSWLETFSTIAALLFAAMFFFTALQRLTYPYDLDFDEDSILMESLRLARNQPVYVAPNADFNPHVYMPLFFWLGSWIVRVTGASIPPLRLISIGATVATTILIYYIARRESGRTWLAIACAGLFLGGYRINGFWYDVARVDALFVALMVAGLALGIYAQRSNAGLVVSAFVLALAFFTKQSGTFIGVGFALYLFVTLHIRALWFAAPFATFALIPLFALNAWSDSWFFYHVFSIGAADPIEFARIVNFVAFDLFGVMLVLSIAAIALAWFGARRFGWRVIREEPWLIMILFAVLISGLGRARVGGNLNDRMPAYALLCLAPALFYRARAFRWRDALIAAAVLIQFALGVYFPPRYVPTAQMRASGDRLIQRIAAVDGNVFVMMHPYYTLRAGKQPSTQIATLWYVRERGALPLPDDMIARLNQRYYAAIISDASDFETEPAIDELITKNYVVSATLSTDDAPPTNTGVVVRPMLIYLPKP